MSGDAVSGDGVSEEWALSLFRKSVLKQEKYRRISGMMDDPSGLRCLDIGADNGVISLLLRRRGGQWASADLDEHTVASIRGLVGDDVHRLDGARSPFPDRTFDQVVVVDYLEHIPDDRAFAGELARILKPGGRVVINVPHLKPRSLVNRIRHAIGLTDEWHGHLRPGYDLEGIRQVLGPRFEIERAATYSKAFSELVDTGLNGMYLAMRRGSGEERGSSKGTVVTGAEVRKRRKQFLLLSALYPFLWGMAKLDNLLWLQPGYKLIVRARLAS